MCPKDAIGNDDSQHLYDFKTLLIVTLLIYIRKMLAPHL